MDDSSTPKVSFRRFEKALSLSWDDLFGEAARFASSLGPGKVISMSHSQEGAFGMVVVWFYE